MHQNHTRASKNAIFLHFTMPFTPPSLKLKFSKDYMELIHFPFLCILEELRGHSVSCIGGGGLHSKRRSELQFSAHEEGKCLRGGNICEEIFSKDFLCVELTMSGWANTCVSWRSTRKKGFLSYALFTGRRLPQELLFYFACFTPVKL